MHPRTLLLWVAAVLLLSLGGEDPWPRFVALAAAVTVLALRRRHGTRLRPVLLGLALAAALTVAFNFGLSHEGQTVVVSLPGWLPALGGPLTLEGAAYGADLAVGLVACIAAGLALSLVVEPQELVDTLPPVFSRTAAALAAGLGLVPRLGQTFLAVREAQQLRGWRGRGVRSWSAVVVPSVLTTIEGSVLLAEAMEARSFGGGHRTAMPSRPGHRADLVAALASALALAGFTTALLLGQVPGWQPYPGLVLPQLSPWALACSLLLFVPALSR